MKTNKLLLAICLLAVLFLPGCDVIIGIFKAGFWTAIILIAIIAALVFYGYRKFRGR